MRSPTTRLAAAAVIIVTAVSAIVLDRSAASAYAMSDVPRLFKSARVVHLQGWLHFNLTDHGKKVPPVPIERWIDLENSRVRFTGTRIYADPCHVSVTRLETIAEGQYRLALNHTDKKATFYRISEYQRMFETHSTLQDAFGGLFGNIEHFAKFVKIGQDEVDGVMYDVWQCDVPEPDSAMNRVDRYKYWLSTTTGQSARFQEWYKNGADPWRLGRDYTKIERDIPVPESTFALDVPPGYEAENTKQTAIVRELDLMGGLGNDSLRFDPRISFTLNDGSVILGWCSVDTGVTKPQGDLFKDLEFGGMLPRLPVEVCALKPSGSTPGITYTGRHLAWTQKGGRFVEWSLYVPDRLAPHRDEILDFEAICRFNVEKQPTSWTGATVDCGVQIQNEADFNVWVLGAMAELSDDATAPADITYKKVVDLVQRVQTSIKP